MVSNKVVNTLSQILISRLERKKKRHKCWKSPMLYSNNTDGLRLWVSLTVFTFLRVSTWQLSFIAYVWRYDEYKGERTYLFYVDKRRIPINVTVMIWRKERERKRGSKPSLRMWHLSWTFKVPRCSWEFEGRLAGTPNNKAKSKWMRKHEVGSVWAPHPKWLSPIWLKKRIQKSSKVRLATVWGQGLEGLGYLSK